MIDVPRLRVLVLGPRRAGVPTAAGGAAAGLRAAGHVVVSAEEGDIRRGSALLDRFNPHVVLAAPVLLLDSSTQEAVAHAGAALVGVQDEAVATTADSGYDLVLTSGIDDGDHTSLAPPPPRGLFRPPAVYPETALAPLPPLVTDADVLVVGDASDRPGWQRAAKLLGRSVRVRAAGPGWPVAGSGPVAGAALVQALRAVPLHVHLGPSRSVADSAAAGAFVVVPAGGAAQRLAEELLPRDGFVAFADQAELEKSVRDLLENVREVRARGRRNADHVLAHHRWQHNCVALLTELVRAADHGETDDRVRQALDNARAEALPPPLRVLAVGWYGTGNTGDELILESLRRSVEDDVPGGQLVVAAKDPVMVRTVHGVEAFDRLDRDEADEQVRRAAGVLVGGGGLWHDYTFAANDGVSGIFTGATASVGALAVLPLIAAVHGVPVHVVGVGAGPLDDPDARAVVRFVADHAASITVRDPESAALLTGIDRWRAAIDVAPDLVYALARGAAPLSRLPSQWAQRQVLGLNLRPWPGSRAFEAEVARVVADHVARGGAVAAVPLQAADAAVLRRVLSTARVRAEDAVVLDPVVDVDQVLVDLADCDGLVAQRLHACLLGHRSGVPVLGVAYDPKVRRHFDELGRGDHVLTLDQTDRLAGAVEDLLAERTLPEDVRRRVGELEVSARESLRRVLTGLGRQRPAEPVAPLRFRPAAAPGSVTVLGRDGAVVSGSTLAPDRQPATRLRTLTDGLRIQLAGPVVLAGDHVTWTTTLPGDPGHGRRIHVELTADEGSRRAGQEQPSSPSTLWQLLLDDRVVAEEEPGRWEGRITLVVALADSSAAVRVGVRTLVLEEATRLQEMAAVTIHQVRGERWDRAPSDPLRRRASVAPLVTSTSPATRVLT